MPLLHTAGKTRALFDDPNLIADAGLVPQVRLAEGVGLPELVSDTVKITDADNSGGANAPAKVMTTVAAMAAGGPHRRCGPPAAYRDAGACRGHPRTVDSGHVSAVVHPRSCAAVACGASQTARRVGPAGPTAARRR